MFTKNGMLRCCAAALLVLGASVAIGASMRSHATTVASNGAATGPKISIQSGISGYMIAVS